MKQLSLFTVMSLLSLTAFAASTATLEISKVQAPGQKASTKLPARLTPSNAPQILVIKNTSEIAAKGVKVDLPAGIKLTKSTCGKSLAAGASCQITVAGQLVNPNLKVPALVRVESTNAAPASLTVRQRVGDPGTIQTYVFDKPGSALEVKVFNNNPWNAAGYYVESVTLDTTNHQDKGYKLLKDRTDLVNDCLRKQADPVHVASECNLYLDISKEATRPVTILFNYKRFGIDEREKTYRIDISTKDPTIELQPTHDVDYNANNRTITLVPGTKDHELTVVNNGAFDWDHVDATLSGLKGVSINASTTCNNGKVVDADGGKCSISLDDAGIAPEDAEGKLILKGYNNTETYNVVIGAEKGAKITMVPDVSGTGSLTERAIDITNDSTKAGAVLKDIKITNPDVDFCGPESTCVHKSKIGIEGSIAKQETVKLWFSVKDSAKAKAFGTEKGDITITATNNVDPAVIRTFPVDTSHSLYAAGSKMVNQQMTGFITRYDGQKWATVADLDGGVYALAMDPEGNLVAGGDFQKASETLAHSLVSFNGDHFASVFDGINGPVLALANHNGKLITAGAFTQINNKEHNYVVAYDGKNIYSLGLGLEGGTEARALGIYNGQLVIGGNFTKAVSSNNTPVSARYIALYKDGKFTALGSGLGGYLKDRSVYGVAVTPQGTLVAMGSFSRAGNGAVVSYIAQFVNGKWVSMGTGANNIAIVGMPYEGNAFLAGGAFTSINNVPSNYINEFYENQWVGTKAPALDGYVVAMNTINDHAYIGGYFTKGGTEVLNHIAEFTGSQWKALGNGVPNGDVNAILSVTSIEISSPQS